MDTPEDGPAPGSITTTNHPDAPPVQVGKYPLTVDVDKDLGNRFTYHAPKPDQPPRYEALRNLARVLAAEIVKNTPKSREQSAALTHLETAIFFANAAIARHE